MRALKSFTIVASILLLATGAAWAIGGISGTDHDFTPTGASSGQVPDFTAPVGLCTYCHTPHQAGTTRLIWNHMLPNAGAGSNYSWGDVTQTIGGTVLPTISTTWTGPSKFCLSCHDGTVDVGQIYWFNEAPQDFNAGLKMTDSHTVTYNSAGTALRGANLKGNHPVAVPYPFNHLGSSYNGTSTGTTVLVDDFLADPQSGGIRLFNDNGGSGPVLAGAASGHTGIECSSCHDPHNGPTAVGEMFLRGQLTGGAGSDYICLKCHNK